MRKSGGTREIPPPLELLCLNALWSLREAKVTGVRQAVSGKKALAYTTVMTVLERLVRRNLVSRRKVGRSFVYAPQTSRDDVRHLALREFVESYFDGSEQQLMAFLQNGARPAAFEEIPVNGEQPAVRLDIALL